VRKSSIRLFLALTRIPFSSVKTPSAVRSLLINAPVYR
jgi:hypothetical protein